MSEENTQTEFGEPTPFTEIPTEEAKVIPIEPVATEAAQPDPVVEAEKAMRKAKFDVAFEALRKEHNCAVIPVIILTAGNVQALIETRAL